MRVVKGEMDAEAFGRFNDSCSVEVQKDDSGKPLRFMMYESRLENAGNFAVVFDDWQVTHDSAIELLNHGVSVGCVWT